MPRWLRIMTLICTLVLFSLNTSAQSSTSTNRRAVERSSSGSLRAGKVMVDPGKVSIPANAPGSAPIRKDGYEDSSLKELQNKLDERKWGSEDTAWERACAIGTRDAYQKYTAMYPYGAHVPQATQRIIDIDVETVLNNPHSSLPGFKHVQSDEDSEYSTIVIENSTGVVLHILYSGLESKELYIIRGGTATITVPNGNCKIAAMVDSPNVRPFAGKGVLEGGRYEVTFYINSSQSQVPPPPPGWLYRLP